MRYLLMVLMFVAHKVELMLGEPEEKADRYLLPSQ